MRFYEDLNHISENRLPQRAYYIPENKGAYGISNFTMLISRKSPKFQAGKKSMSLHVGSFAAMTTRIIVM